MRAQTHLMPPRRLMRAVMRRGAMRETCSLRTVPSRVIDADAHRFFAKARYAQFVISSAIFHAQVPPCSGSAHMPQDAPFHFRRHRRRPFSMCRCRSAIWRPLTRRAE